MSTEIVVRQTDSIFDQVRQRFERIQQRAFDRFQLRGAGAVDRALDDWLDAERELALEPQVQFSETDQGYEVQAALPGMDVKDVHVEVTNDDVLITAEKTERHYDREGDTESCLRVFRVIHFPKAIDAERVKAEYREGVLSVKAGLKPAPAPVALPA
jgi:HSP20 family protein